MTNLDAMSLPTVRHRATPALARPGWSRVALEEPTIGTAPAAESARVRR